MIIGNVIGNIYSTINHKFYDGKTLLLVKMTVPNKGYIIAVDSVGAGVGQTVLIVDEGNSARQVVNDSKAPIRSIVVGIVDEVKTD